MQREPVGLVFKPPGLREAPFSTLQTPGEPKHMILVQHEPTYPLEYLCWIRIIQRSKTASRLKSLHRTPVQGQQHDSVWVQLTLYLGSALSLAQTAALMNCTLHLSTRSKPGLPVTHQLTRALVCALEHGHIHKPCSLPVPLAGCLSGHTPSPPSAHQQAGGSFASQHRHRARLRNELAACQLQVQFISQRGG